MIDYYATLGVARDATASEIRNAYLELARMTHPDKVTRAERRSAEDAFKYVTAAYDTLSRERSRREYTSRLPSVQVAPKTEAKPASTESGTHAAQPVVIATTGRVQFDALAQGIAAFKTKDYHTAVQLLNMAVSQDQADAKAQFMLSLALAKNPNWVRDALNHMETACKLDPKNVTYQVELALLLHSLGLKLRARRTLETAAAANPAHPDVVRALQEIPMGSSDTEASGATAVEAGRGLFDRLRKR